MAGLGGMRGGLVAGWRSRRACHRRSPGCRSGFATANRRIGVTTNGETATYRLFVGDPLPLRHHGNEFELGAEPVTLPIPHWPAEAPPTQPPGREPRAVRESSSWNDRRPAVRSGSAPARFPRTLSKMSHDEHPDEALEQRPAKLSDKTYEKRCSGCSASWSSCRSGCATRGLKLCVLFEGRDAAGKGGTIKRIVERTNPRVVRVVALGTPTEKEKTQWYFQRYVAAPARRRRDRALRPRPGTTAPASSTSWDSAPRTSTRSSCARARVRADADPLGDRAREVLVLGERRGAGAALPGAHRGSREAVEAEPDGPRSRASGGPTTRGPRTRCSATPTPSCRRGGWSTPTTSGARGSTASATC